MKKFTACLVFCALLLAASQAFAGATITIVNNNLPGVGFNDPTPAAPVGNNTGTTKGQQALNAFQFAASRWGSTLDSKAEIRILASFEPLSCTPTAGTLGSAGTIFVFDDGVQFYHSALADKIVGFDLLPGQPDIRARFNSQLGTAACLTGLSWYLGMDNNANASQIDLSVVLLHEFAHGLGFSTFENSATGALFAGLPDVYNNHLADNRDNIPFPALTDAGRQAAIIGGHVIWTGSHVDTAVPTVLQPGTPLLHIASPASIAGNYKVGAASFGPPLSSPGVTGTIVAALDPADAFGPTTFDACSPITNAADVAGNIALVTRGTCGFIVKVKNAQNAGATAVIVADNAAGSPPAGLGGADPTITIPSVRVTQADGLAIRAALPATGTLGVDLSVRAGADTNDHALMYSPNPVILGSSISHWDTSAFPNQLMEPNINGDLTYNVTPPQDMTLPLLRDVGWYPDADLDLVSDEGDDACLNSDLTGTVIIGSNNSGVPNTLFANGCTIKDFVNQCLAHATNRGSFNSCVAHLGDSLLSAGVITQAQKDALQSAAARAKLP